MPTGPSRAQIRCTTSTWWSIVVSPAWPLTWWITVPSAWWEVLAAQSLEWGLWLCASSLPEPRNMSRAIFLIAYSSPLKIAWPRCRTLAVFSVLTYWGLSEKPPRHLHLAQVLLVPWVCPTTWLKWQRCLGFSLELLHSHFLLRPPPYSLKLTQKRCSISTPLWGGGDGIQGECYKCECLQSKVTRKNTGSSFKFEF